MKPCQFTIFYKIPFQDTAKPWPLGQRLLQKGRCCNYCCCLKGVYLGHFPPGPVHHGQEKFIQIARRSLQTTTRWGSWYCATFTMLVVRGCVSKLEVREFTGFHVLFWVFINHFLWIVCKCSCHFTQHERGALSLEWSNKNRRPNQTKLKRSFYHLTTPTATVQFWSETFPGYNFGTSSFAAGWSKRNMISNNRSTNIAIRIYKIPETRTRWRSWDFYNDFTLPHFLSVFLSPDPQLPPMQTLGASALQTSAGPDGTRQRLCFF